MAVSFDVGAVFFDFLVTDSDGRIPLPAPDENGLEWLAGTIVLASRADARTLRAYWTKVNPVPAMGGGGLLNVTQGPGFRHFTYPTGNNVNETRFAMLTAWSEMAHILKDSDRRVDVVFLMGDLVE